MRVRCLTAGIAACCLCLAPHPPARADFIPIPLPDAAYLASTERLPVTVPDLTSIESLADPNLTVGFSVPLQARTVPTTWLTWSAPPLSESPTPRVLFTGPRVTALTLTFSQPLLTFGVELEPNPFVVAPLTATFLSGPAVVGSITLNVDGAGGARLFAATTTTEPFTGVILSAPAPADGLALAQVRYTAIPEPSPFMLVGGAALGGLLGYVRRRGKRAV
jgi:hypothetical protein